MVDVMLNGNREGEISSLGMFPVKGLFALKRNPSNLTIKMMLARHIIIYSFRLALSLFSVPFFLVKVKKTQIKLGDYRTCLMLCGRLRHEGIGARIRVDGFDDLKGKNALF